MHLAQPNPSQPPSEIAPASAPVRPAACRASFAFSTGAAVALNGVVLAFAAAAAGLWQPGAAPLPQRIAWVTSIGPDAPRSDARPTAAPPRPPDPPATPNRPLASAAAAQPPADAAPAPALAQRVADPLPATTLATANSPPDASLRFYDFAEVERPAEPDSDWNLDPAVLDSSGVQTLVFDIFIGPAGEVVGCTILSPTEIAPETRQVLEERLRQTVTRPALREGIAVASVRRIEMSVVPPGS